MTSRRHTRLTSRRRERRIRRGNFASRLIERGRFAGGILPQSKSHFSTPSTGGAA